MASYTDEQRTHAVEVAAEHGPAEASRRLNIPRRTISDWMRKTGVQPPKADAEKAADMRAKAAERVATEWADYRSQQAAASGAMAARLRDEVRDRLAAGAAGRDIQALATAFGIFIDKAELLSDRATSRIETWAVSELDRDLRSLVDEMEDRIRESS